LAAQVHQTKARHDDPSAYETINVEGSRFVAEQAARAGVKRFVFLSSAKVNGENSNGGLFQADGPIEPQDAYARSKASAERIIREVCERASMEYVIVRPPLVYGPGVRANFHRLLRLADLGWPLPLGSIANRRSLVAAENLADFIETCMVHPHAAGRVWLISDGEDLSTPELIGRIARFMHRPLRLFHFSPVLLTHIAKLIGWGGEAARLCDSLVLDVRPALQLLDWRAPMSLDDGLRETVADYVGRRRN
jgi:nucleoside-diphosphate-sugar epimerase